MPECQLTHYLLSDLRCLTLKDAWHKLTGAYRSPIYIARLLLKDFYDLKRTKANDETNLIQLKNALDKLQSDLTTNECPKRCNDFAVIDQAESLVLGRFCHKYVEKKDQLLTEHGSSFKALSVFLDTEASLIQKYMPDKMIEETSTSKESSNSKESKKTKAKIAKLKAKVVDDKTASSDKKE